VTYNCSQYFESLKSALYFWSGTSILVVAVYWIFAGVYTIVDITNKPAALRRYKVQPGTNEQLDSKCLMKASIECLYPKHIYLNTSIISAWNDVGCHPLNSYTFQTTLFSVHKEFFNELPVLSTVTSTRYWHFRCEWVTAQTGFQTFQMLVVYQLSWERSVTAAICHVLPQCSMKMFFDKLLAIHSACLQKKAQV
jgi:hypothetical protein